MVRKQTRFCCGIRQGSALLRTGKSRPVHSGPGLRNRYADARPAGKIGLRHRSGHLSGNDSKSPPALSRHGLPHAGRPPHALVQQV